MKTIVHSSQIQELDKNFQPEGLKTEIKEGRLKNIRFQLPSEKSLGKREGHSRPTPTSSKFKEEHEKRRKVVRNRWM